MASANVTLAGSSAHEFEVDSDERTATLQKPGGSLIAGTHCASEP